MHARISALEIPTTDPRLAIRVYEALFDTRLTARALPDAVQMALLFSALSMMHRTGPVAHFTDSDGNLMALQVHD